MIWTQLSILLVTTGVFCIIASELLLAFPTLDSARWIVAAALGGTGLGGWLVGWRRSQRRAEAEGAANASLQLDMRYWSLTLVLLGTISLFIQPFRRLKSSSKTVPTVPLVIRSEPAQTNTAPVTHLPVVFPDLKIQGYILHKVHPEVFINGHAYGKGDQVEGLTVKSVTREGVLMEKGGQTKLYRVQ